MSASRPHFRSKLKYLAAGQTFHGERQLIAMTHALLRRSPIVAMNEVIDFATDLKIEEFAAPLLITAAHRLQAITDFDWLLVDKGQVVECDTPVRLIQKEDRFFRDMCLQSGTFGQVEAEV
ncbi:hypothetical protein B0H19DRAFT_1161327 [Mycena capillaripes]|nr:hypothetical protein B0H19DRAFT_1161327 [Mycena capillaripes]